MLTPSVAKPGRPTSAAFGRGKTIYISVKGMWCAGCAFAAERILRRQPGVLAADIGFASERGRIQFDPSETDSSAVVQSLNGLGYSARVIGDTARKEVNRRQQYTLLQLIAAVAFGMQVMSLSIVHLYPAYAVGQFDAPEIRSVQYLAWLLATPVLFFGGSTFLRGAWRALRARTATMDTLVALGTLSAYGYSVYFTVSGGGEVYFDSVTMITVFVVIGRYLETVGGDQARKDVRTLLRLQPDNAWLWDGGAWREVAAAGLVPGDRILVKPGERVPTEAEIVEGQAALDEALLTGEPAPVDKYPGDIVFAGTLSTDGALICSAIRPPGDTRLADMARTVEQTLATKPPIQRLADTASAWFALCVLIIATLTFLVWWNVDHEASRGLLAAVAVLVVACPCALGLATPFAISIALGRTTRAGILVRNLAALEIGGRVGRVVFDKTGTLTSGRMTVTGVAVYPSLCLTEVDLLGCAAAVEQHSEHPFAKAIVAACPPGPLAVAADFQASRGKGASAFLTGTVSGQISVGSRDYVGADDDALDAEAAVAAELGQSIVWVALGGKLAGFIALRDEPHVSTRSMLHQMEETGISVVMLSGDQSRTTTAIAAELGLADAEGDCSPTDKAERIRAWQNAGEVVAMVGDGINDAPALAQADLSIAMDTGADVAGETSDLILARFDLTLIPWFLRFSRRTGRIIRQNLAWAFAYNLLMVPLAATGEIGPIVAAGAMAVSSLLVVGNSLRLRH